MSFRFLNFRHLSCKLILSYSLITFFVILLAMGATFLTVRKSIEQNIDETLTMQIDLIKNSIEISTDASIKNYYRGISLSASSIVDECFDKFQGGELTEIEAQSQAWSFINHFSVGPSGYLVILDSKGKTLFHPDEEIVGTDADVYSFVQTILENDEVFFEYEWLEPGDEQPSNKLMYSIRIQPWNWYIGVTGYKEELLSLVAIEDFEDKILAIRFGETGYPIVLDNEGTFLIHPDYKGLNMMNRDDSMGEITRKALAERNGKAEYFWRNPGENDFRKKLTLYSEIPQFGLVVAATAYESEFFKPLKILEKVYLITFLLSLGLIVLLTQRISRNITRPIIELRDNMDQAAGGELKVRSKIISRDEIGTIGKHFNHFLCQLQLNQEDMEKQLLVNSSMNKELISSLSELHQAQQRLIEEERFANMGRLIARVSHHLNTPLGVAITAVTYMERQAQEFLDSFSDKALNIEDVTNHTQSQIKASDLLKKSLDQAIDMIKSFRKLQIDINQRDLQSIDVKIFLHKDYLTIWDKKLPEYIKIVLECSDNVKLYTYREVLLLILNHLTENSIAHGFANHQDGIIRISVIKKNGGVEIIYSDSGIGIAIEDTERVFEPFFSSDGHFNKSGIGLNIVYNAVVGNLSGTIKYHGNKESGVCYTIFLPDKKSQS